MTGAAVLRAGRTRAGLARSQGARGWARSQSRSVPPPRARVRQPQPPRPAPPGSSPPQGLRPGRGGRGGPLDLTGGPCHQPGLEGSPAIKGTLEAPAWRSAGCTSEDAPWLRGGPGRAGARPTPSRGPRCCHAPSAPTSLSSALVCPGCKFYAAQSERRGPETRPTGLGGVAQVGGHSWALCGRPVPHLVRDAHPETSFSPSSLTFQRTLLRSP